MTKFYPVVNYKSYEGEITLSMPQIEGFSETMHVVKTQKQEKITYDGAH